MWNYHETPLSNLDPESPRHRDVPLPFHSISMSGPMINKQIFLDQIEHLMIKPRLKLQLLCFFEKLSIALCLFFFSLTSTRFRRAELTAKTATTELPSSSTSMSVISSITLASRSSSSGTGGRLRFWHLISLHFLRTYYTMSLSPSIII